jgi:ferredoxin--NADP+ reductase
MKIEELDLGQRWSARLVENTALTPPGARDEVRELTLEVDAPGQDFLAGQSVAVLVAGPHGFGQRQHVRLYTVARTPAELGPGRFSLCVRRCTYLDPYSGERFPGIASNFLCDLPAGSELLLGGPVGLPFVIPEDPHTPLLIVGLGTGIAPFRAMLRELYEERHWQGRVMLFHGARVGLETVYRDAIADVCKRSASYSPVEVVSPRPAYAWTLRQGVSKLSPSGDGLICSEGFSAPAASRGGLCTEKRAGRDQRGPFPLLVCAHEKSGG